MKRKAVSGTTQILLMLSMLTMALNIQPVKTEPITWTVDDDGPADFHTIQEAINAANPGDVIYVFKGTYYENVVLNKTVSLVGEDKNFTVIDGRNIGNVVTITANNTRISGFRIQNSSSDPTELHSGIQAINSTGNKISDNIVTNNVGFGIVVDHSDHNILLNNLVVNNTEVGIYLEQSSYNSLIYNNVLTNERDGIRLFKSFNNSIISNTITDNDNGIWLDLSSDNNIVSNTISNNHNVGIWLASSSNNSIINNNVANNRFDGIDLSFLSSNNDIIGNTIAENNRGIVLFFAQNGNPANNNIYHNNFVDNQDQTYINVLFENNWDDGYPSGGNYWTDYVVRYPLVKDEYQGENQDVPGSDGIWDSPYVIDENNQDNYPLTSPWTPTPVVTATIDIDPDTLNLKSKGRWITAYIELPEGYNVSDIYRTTILLNDTVPVDPFWIDKPIESVIGDYDEDRIPDLMVKFDRAAVINYVMDHMDWSNPERTKPLIYKVTLTVTGNLYNGTQFEGRDVIRVLKFLKGDPMPI